MQQDFLYAWAHSVLLMTVEMAPWLLVGFLFAGFLHAFLPKGWVQTFLSGEGLRGALRGALVGVPLPLCSCGVIPLADYLRQKGASKSATMAFLISTPMTGLDSILATFVMLGPLLAGVRPVVALLAGLLVGLLVSWGQSKVVASSYQESTSLPRELQSVHHKSKYQALLSALEYGFVDLVQGVRRWLWIGLVVGGAISAFLPPESLLNAGIGGSCGHYLLVMALGIPLYVCATGSIPIAAALMAKGMSPGAALLFLLVGPATNIATLSFVKGAWGMRTVLLYLTGLIVVSLAAAIGLDGLTWNPGQSVLLQDIGHHQTIAWWQYGLGLVLLLLMLWPEIRKAIRWLTSKQQTENSSMQIQWTIEGMTCNNCRRHVERIGESTVGVNRVSVDLTSKQAVFEGDFDEQALRQKLTEEGYPPA